MAKKVYTKGRIGEINYNNFGSKMKIVEYAYCDDIYVEFQDEYKTKVHTKYCHFKKGNVGNPYDKTAYDVGYLGIGKYSSKEHKNAYETWIKMLRRCYDPYCINKQLTYKDCFVCEEWHNFQNFAKWYYENYYEIEGQRMELDKDILFKGNKIYSPQTCIFAPQRINLLFTKSNKTRGECLIGMCWHKRDKIFEVHCNIYDENVSKKIYLGRFDKPFQAFTTYKNFKENYIKQVADEYKDLIPQKLYEAMYNYEVEIND